MLYPNNGFFTYVNHLYQQYGLEETDYFLVKLFKLFPVMVGKIMKDAGIELFFLAIFWLIIMKMSQGRDLIVSLFEPNGLYGGWRVFFTTASVISFSLSMWIIPAYLFQLRERRSNHHYSQLSPFRQHLFFIHRVLPLIPFWLLAATLFNSGMVWFFAAAIGELALLYLFNHKVSSAKAYRNAMIGIGVILLITTTYFFVQFQKEYTLIKVIFSLNLYLISMLLFLIYHFVDERILMEHAKGDDLNQSVRSKYRINTFTYITCLMIHIIIILLISIQPFHTSFAPESLLLYMFSVFVFIIDLIYYFTYVTQTRRLTAAFIGIALGVLLLTGLWKINVNHYQMDVNPAPTTFTGMRDDFDQRFEDLRRKMIDDTIHDEYPIILIAGEGGGSRAGLWFSQNLVNFDLATYGKFRDHIFSLSTVSGSSVGLSTVFTFWDKTRDSTSIGQQWSDFPGRVFANNYVGSSIRGLLLTDLFKSLTPIIEWKNDRNSALLDEEAYTTELAVISPDKGDKILTPDIPDSLQSLKKDFMYYFYTRNTTTGQLEYRANTPITLINTTRSNDGRRGIFSSIRLNDNYFYEAVDIIGYLYEDSICSGNGQTLCKGFKKKISFGQACNTSELFPILSAPAYIDSLGSFVDGGYHENSGLKTTLDIYTQLRERLVNEPTLKKKKYRVYIVYLKNGAGEKQLYKPMPSKPALFQPLVALFNQPFEGSASYYEEKAAKIRVNDSLAEFVNIALTSGKIFDISSTPVTESKADQANMEMPDKISLEREILLDIMDTVRQPGATKPDTLINFPLARWLSKTIIERIKLSASLNKQSDSVKSLLKKVNGSQPLNPAVFTEFRENKVVRVPKVP